MSHGRPSSDVLTIRGCMHRYPSDAGSQFSLYVCESFVVFCDCFCTFTCRCTFACHKYAFSLFPVAEWSDGKALFDPEPDRCVLLLNLYEFIDM